MISDPWIEPRPSRDLDVVAKTRRDRLRAMNRCINGPYVGSVGFRGVVHGPVVKAGKCQRCIDIHNGTNCA